MQGIEVTLADVLQFREKKAWIQSQMGEGTAVVVSLGMNIPGPVKCSPSIFRAFCAGQAELEKEIEGLNGKILRKERIEETAGYAAVYLVENVDGYDLKKMAVKLEESHVFGRLWDIDIVGKDGTALSRAMAGAERRKCLICGEDAKICGRSRRHSVPELQNRVRGILEEWKEPGYEL